MLVFMVRKFVLGQCVGRAIEQIFDHKTDDLPPQKCFNSAIQLEENCTENCHFGR